MPTQKSAVPLWHKGYNLFVNLKCYDLANVKE
jgi:hypothetical protein